MSVYRLDQSEVPVPGGELTPETAINALAPATGERDALIYGAGRRLHVFDVSRPESPVEVTSLPLRVDASRALRQGDMLYVFGKAGLEMFDLPSEATRRPSGSCRRSATSGTPG